MRTKDDYHMSVDMITVDQIESLAAYDTPTIANALEMLQVSNTQFIGTAIRAAVPIERPMVGIVATATMKEQWGGKFAHLIPGCGTWRRSSSRLCRLWPCSTMNPRYRDVKP